MLIVTRQGWGDVWETPDGEFCPLYQYGDTLLEEPSDVCSQYSLFELERLLKFIGDEEFEQRIMRTVFVSEQPSVLRAKYSEVDTMVFDRLVKLAKSVPSDPSDLIKLIVDDRQVTKETTMTEATATAPKAKKEPKAPKYAPDAIITMGVDKESNKYGAKNNPKRATSKSAERFANYKDGMKVQKALDAGITTADFDNDIAKGFITIA